MKPINSHKIHSKLSDWQMVLVFTKVAWTYGTNTFVQGNKMPKVSIFNSWSIPNIVQDVIFLGLIWLLRSLTQKCWSIEY